MYDRQTGNNASCCSSGDGEMCMCVCACVHTCVLCVCQSAAQADRTKHLADLPKCAASVRGGPFTLTFLLSLRLLSRKFLKSLIQKQPQELLLVIGTGVSAAAAPGIPALCSWRSCLEAVIETAEQLDVLHPGDAAQFRRKVQKDRDLLVVAHDLIRKMSPVSAAQVALGTLVRAGGESGALTFSSYQPTSLRVSSSEASGWGPSSLSFPQSRL